jgi:hypothetical protein
MWFAAERKRALVIVNGRAKGAVSPEARTAKGAAPGVARRAETGDLPDRLFGNRPVQPHLQKYFRSRLTQIRCISRTSRPTRGAIARRHERGAGCGGRKGVRRANSNRRAR